MSAKKFANTNFISMFANMSNPYFQFKQFKINHDRCAMKVGTDGVLLGAWTSIDTLNKEESTRVLDIGTGSGLIALMIAQRTSSLNKLFIDALEIDATASIQAQENVLCSPWKDKISIIHGDFTDANLLSKLLLDNGPYQLIVTNPPYFIDSLNSPNEQRTVARHTQTGLNFEQLIKGVLHLLDVNGLFSLILPTSEADRFIDLATSEELYLTRRTNLLTKPGGKIRRVMMQFEKKKNHCIEDEMLIELSRHQYSDEYKALTAAFYLDK